MARYIYPKSQNNYDLKKGSKVRARLVDIRISLNDSLREILILVFVTDCGHVIVQKQPYSLSEDTELGKLYYAVTGKNINIALGFATEEILNKEVIATVGKYEFKGYECTKLVDFE
jgi:hypothetical protein